MILLNVTALLIYRLYGRFGIFHWFAVASCLTLLGGLYPVLTKKSKNYLLTHFNFMYWSVIGLYCALMAEIFSRLPKIILTASGEPMTIFYKLVGIGIALVMAIGIFFYIKYRPIWTRQFERK
jgi:FtsH-binding integral membrane protein